MFNFLKKLIKYTIVYPIAACAAIALVLVMTGYESKAPTEVASASEVEITSVLPQAERNEYLCREILTGWAFGDEEAKNIGRALTTAFEYKQSRIEITHTTVKEFDTSTKQGNVRLCKVEYANLL